MQFAHPAQSNEGNAVFAHCENGTSADFLRGDWVEHDVSAQAATDGVLGFRVFLVDVSASPRKAVVGACEQPIGAGKTGLVQCYGHHDGARIDGLAGISQGATIWLTAHTGITTDGTMRALATPGTTSIPTSAGCLLENAPAGINALNVWIRCMGMS